MPKNPKDQRIARVSSAVNPCRRGTDRYRRVAAVLRSRTVEEALRRGARRTTVRFCRQRRLVK